MKIIFVNGVKTSYKDVLSITRRLSVMFDHPVFHFYNPSMSFTTALIESAYNRWHYLFRILPDTPQVKRLSQEIRDTTDGYQEVLLIGHSQGCVLTINAINRLNYSQQYYVSAILFAPTNTQEPAHVEHIEYFLNDRDWVIKLLPGNYIKKGIGWIKGLFSGAGNPKRKGRMYLREGVGHFLGSDYLDHLEEFRNFKESKLSSLLKSNK